MKKVQEFESSVQSARVLKLSNYKQCTISSSIKVSMSVKVGPVLAINNNSGENCGRVIFRSENASNQFKINKTGSVYHFGGQTQPSGI